MGITLRHDAAVAAFGPSRQNRRFGQQLAIQQQQNKFTDQQREKDRWFDIQRQQAQNEFQTLRDRRMNAAENRRMQQAFENQRTLANDRQAAEQQMVRQQNAVADQRWKDQQAAEQQQWENRRNTEQMDMQAQIGQQRRQQDLASLKAGISQADLTAEGKAEAGKLLGDLKSIEAQRDSLRPDQYNKLVDEWMNRYNESGLSNYVKPVPQIDLELQSQSKDLGTGMTVFRQPDGKWQVLETDPSKTKPAKGSDAMAQIEADVPFEQWIQNPELDASAKQSMYEQGKKIADAKIQQSAPEGSTTVRQPTDDEIKEGMKQAYAEKQQMSRVVNSFGQPQPATQPPAQTPVAQPAPPQAAPVQPEQLPNPSPVQPQSLLKDINGGMLTPQAPFQPQDSKPMYAEPAQQPAVQNLDKAKLSPYDYAAARRVISNARANYPNMSDMPPDVRASVEDALSVINAAR